MSMNSLHVDNRDISRMHHRFSARDHLLFNNHSVHGHYNISFFSKENENTFNSQTSSCKRIVKVFGRDWSTCGKNA
jgi:hypothetical protein